MLETTIQHVRTISILNKLANKTFGVYSFYWKGSSELVCIFLLPCTREHKLTYDALFFNFTILLSRIPCILDSIMQLRVLPGDLTI